MRSPPQCFPAIRPRSVRIRFASPELLWWVLTAKRRKLLKVLGLTEIEAVLWQDQPLDYDT